MIGIAFAAALLVVDGRVATPLTLERAAVAGAPVARGAWLLRGQPVDCEGVWLADVLAKAGTPLGEGMRGDAMRLVVVARAADGYRAIFTLAELDRRIGNAPVLVADRCGGKPLEAGDGPFRLLSIGDARGARSVRRLERLTVKEVE